MSTVLVTVDSLRPDHLGQHGYERDTFPALDRLADGDRYTAAFANGTHSAESIPSYLRSRYQPSLAPDEPTLASVLGDAGVTTGAIHANAVYDELVGDAGGFDHYDHLTHGDSIQSDPPLTKRVFRGAMDLVRPTVERLGIRKQAERVQEFLFPSSLIHAGSEYVRAATVTDVALDWFDGVDGDAFLWVHYMDPHRPYGVSDPEFAYGALPSREESYALMSKAGLRPEQVTDTERERMCDWYDSDVRYTSHHVGRLLDGLPAETNVVFTADHGDEFGEHGAYFHRNRPYDELISVPLVVRGPETTGETRTAQRELVDLGPTICRWHDASPPGTFQGAPLSDGDPRRVLATGSQLDTGPVHAGRWDGWKFIRGETEEELYDLTVDPREQTNRRATKDDRASQYDRYLRRVLDDDDGLSVGADDVDDDAARERLEQLGYLDGSVDN